MEGRGKPSPPVTGSIHLGVNALLRIGLSVYLMLATLVGPWLCCCQPPRLSARFVALLRNEEAKSAENHHSCCQHQAPVNDSQPTNTPKAPSCPCQGNRPALVTPVSDGTRQLHRDSNAQAVDLLDHDSLSGVLMPSFGLTLTSSLLSSPFLTGRDILSSLHILRC
jgi:hypothetical protein